MHIVLFEYRYSSVKDVIYLHSLVEINVWYLRESKPAVCNVSKTDVAQNYSSEPTMTGSQVGQSAYTQAWACPTFKQVDGSGVGKGHKSFSKFWVAILYYRSLFSNSVY